MLANAIEQAKVSHLIGPYDLSLRGWNEKTSDPAPVYSAPSPTFVAASPSATKTASASDSRCPSGTRYAHIQSGGLLFKKTHFKGCASWEEINFYEAQADRADRNRWARARAINDAAQEYNSAIQQSQPRFCTTNVFGSTAYTNCY
ncbi:hypothetical protein SynA1562_01871 [Synechococcus sp. A15-62]|uniref:hypothetical protein n=1 Tax=Synechococcus sp. A15-62 TaxID=1050657 RepID=UPI001645FB01|nr:hypothetical protein [Synechococcus sp. A15-62]QNJ00699.1 hypothetical protein SynA1562_01871 [Synechococcus sp. A15-62]